MIRTFIFAFMLFAAGTLSFTAQAETNKEEIEKIIHEYIMENPKLIMDSVEKYQREQYEAQMRQATEKFSDHKGYLTGKDVPSAGNPEGDITIVEFFDYNCGYCKKALPDVQKIIEADSNVRVTLIDMPILGPTSETASRWALAADKQGKYFEFHVALMNHKGGKDVKSLEKLATEVGLDVEQIKKDASSQDIDSAINKNRAIAQELGITGTPAFIINDSVQRGYIGFEAMKSIVESERETL